MWKLLKAYPANEQGLVVRLQSIQDNVQAKRAVSKLTAAKLNEEDGLDELLKCLDAAFQDEKSDQEYENYKK